MTDRRPKPGIPYLLSEMSREWWIIYSWEHVREVGGYSVYLCTGHASVEGAEQRGRDWDIMTGAMKEINDES